jgi:YVTN family beta-propeller protein
MRLRSSLALVVAAAALTAAPAIGATPHASLGSPDYRLPNGWHLHPAGHEVVTQRGPTGLTVTPDRQHVLVVTSGIFDEGLDVVDATTLTSVPTQGVDFWRGVAVTPNNTVFTANGSYNTVSTYKLAGDAAVPTTPAQMAAPGWPGPIAAAADGRVFVGGTLSTEQNCAAAPPCSDVDIIRSTHPRTVPVGRDAIALTLNPKHATLYVANWADATVSVLDVARPGAERVVQTIPVGQHPVGIAVSPDGTRLAIANAADDTITVANLDGTGRVITTHSTDLRLTADAPVGTAPDAVSFSPTGNYLYAAMSGLNAIEVLTKDGQPIPRTVHVGATTVHVPHTWIATGWWPDAMAATTSPTGGERLYVTNLRGDGTGPGWYGQVMPVTGSKTEGSLSVIDMPAAATRASTLDTWTAQVVANDQLAPLYDAALPDPARNPCTAAPTRDGAVRSAILCAASRGQIDPRTVHVLIINNENKTYDSYFGDDTKLTNANANPAFTEFGRESTPNQHRLAEQYNVDDSFYTDGDSSSEGHEWLTGGYETDAMGLTWGQQYAEGTRGDRGSIGGTAAAIESRLSDPRTRLSDEVATSNTGLTEAIYGDDLNADSPSLADQAPLKYWGLGPDAISGKDMTFPDVDRAQMFLHGTTISHAWNWLKGPQPPSTFLKRISYSPADKKRFTLDAWTTAYKSCRAGGSSDASCQATMPNYFYLVMPVNHTYVLNDGFNPLDPTPQAEVADNDDGVGQLIAGLSRSPFWKNTLVLLTQDDTQFTGDHLDIHRSFLLTMGGLARRLGPQGRVATQPGSYPAAIKTAETLLGLPPLSIFDWRAAPLADVVGDAPTAAAPYDVVRPATAFLVPPPWSGPPAGVGATLHR